MSATQSTAAVQRDNGHGAPPLLLGERDPPPVELLNTGGRARVLVVCDHASRAIPASLSRLGLDESSTHRHIAWDIGAAELSRQLSARLDAPAVLAGYSRLVIDCNRQLEDPTCFLALADGERVPGNEALTQAERHERARACYEPYHKAIAIRLRDFRLRGTVPALISIHSFTPVLGTQVRAWHVGVLWDRDPRIAVPLLARLRARDGLVVGDNEPYSGRHPADYTVDHHAESAGLPHVCIEVRQDQLASADAVARWADMLAQDLGRILGDERLYQAWDDTGQSLRGPR